MIAGETSIRAAREAYQAGRVEDALRIARGLLARLPDDVDTLEILALCEGAQGRNAAAEATLRRIIVLAPEKKWPRDDLARLLMRDGRGLEAEAVARDAIAYNSGNADAQALLGASLSERGLLVAGARHLEQAIGLARRHPQLIASLGRNLMRQGRLAEAEPLLREAIAGDPAALAPRAHLAELAEQRDDFAGALALLDEAEPLARQQGKDVLAQRAAILSRTERWREGLALLDAVPDPAGTPRLLRARMRDRAGRYDEAWGDAVAAKAQLAGARGHAYGRDAFARDAERMRKLAAAAGGLTPVAVPEDGPKPIFILGFPRSGTTLLEQVLASHSRICPGGELPCVGAMAALAERIDSTTPDGARQLRDVYLRCAAEHGLCGPGADYFTDKMPLNELYLPLLVRAFPDAPLIAVRRDPRDVLVSVMQHDMTHGFYCGYDLRDAAEHLAAMDALMAEFADAGLLPYRFVYERFVADQIGETEHLAGQLGHRIEQSQRDFHLSRRHAPTPSYAQVREPLNDRSIGRWRNYAAQLAPVMERLAPAIARGGY